MKIFVFVLLVSLVQVSLRADNVKPCVEGSICAYGFYGDTIDKTVTRCTCVVDHKCIQQEDDLDLSAHIFRCKPIKVPRTKLLESTCATDAICAYEYYGNSKARSVPHCTCPANHQCVQQEIDLDLSAHIYRCKPKSAPLLESFCDNNAVCAYEYYGDNMARTVTRCRCPANHKCVKHETDMDLSAYILRCQPNSTPRKVIFCKDNAICAYGYFGDNLDQTVFSHKLSR